MKVLFEAVHAGLVLRVEVANDATVEVNLGDDWRVNLDETLIRSLREWLRPENVEIVYQ